MFMHTKNELSSFQTLLQTGRHTDTERYDQTHYYAAFAGDTNYVRCHHVNNHTKSDTHSSYQIIYPV